MKKDFTKLYIIILGIGVLFNNLRISELYRFEQKQEKINRFQREINVLFSDYILIMNRVIQKITKNFYI